jgi:hypothetical protein
MQEIRRECALTCQDAASFRDQKPRGIDSTINTMIHSGRAGMSRCRAVAVTSGALIALLALAAMAAAGPIEDAKAAYARGDYASAWADAKEASWWDLRDAANLFAGTLYAELVKARLASLRPDANQSVIGVAGATRKLTSSYRAWADTACRLAVSFDALRLDSGIHIWSMPDGQPIVTISPPYITMNVVLSQHYIAIAGNDNVALYDARTGSLLRSIDRVDTGTFHFSDAGEDLQVATGKFGGLFGSAIHPWGVENHAEADSTVTSKAPRQSDCPIAGQSKFRDPPQMLRPSTRQPQQPATFTRP